MAWAYVAASETDAALTNAASQTLAPTANTTAGNRLFAALVVQKSSNVTPVISSVSDAKNGTWNHDSTNLHYTDGADEIVIAVYSVQLSSALLTTDNVTVAFSTVPFSGYWAIFEASGLSTAANPVDVQVSNTGTSTASWSAGTTGATGGANEMDLVFYGDDGYAKTWTTAPTVGTVIVNQINLAATGYWIGVKDSGSSGGTQTSTGTLSSATGSWGGMLIAYQLPGVAGTTFPAGYGSSVHWPTYDVPQRNTA